MNDSDKSSVLPGTQPPLAVVGISALFPKAPTTEQFWSNIRRGVDAITEIPATHWDPADFYDENQKTPDMTYARRGGFLSPLPFDPLEFGISPNNLEAIDTSQLLGLVGAKRALDHAGYGAGRTFDRSRVGCILGVTGTLEMVIPLGARLGHPRWRQALKDAGVADDVAEDVVKRISDSYVPWQENSFPGLLGNVVAGRIANRLDLHGTNCVVDAACASSLSAIHLAALELWTGRSDMVVTGGIDTFNDIFMYMCFSKTPALSPSGDAKPFSDEADGTILGEGVGIVVLKRLADAERDGDRIFAVLKGIGTSSDGAGNAVYAPKAEGQIRCLQDAYRVSGVSPDTVELVEAHGTGTKVGDATEVSGLMHVYQSTGRRDAWCAVGSIKSQIGHTKAAAGAAGVIKAILALQHRVLPPTIKVNRPPAAMLSDDSPFYVNTEARPWLKPARHPRRAAVSAFGFGGSNFHCVLEESPQNFDEPDWDGDLQVVALSAMNPGELIQSIRSRIAPLANSEWSAVRSTASQFRNQYRTSHSQRLLLVVERDKTDIAKLVASCLTMLERYPEKDSWSTPDGAYFGRGAAAGKLGVLFPGQGSQYVGMLRELTCRFPVMNDVLSEANEVFETTLELPASGSRLSDYIYPHPSFSAETQSQHDAALRATQIAQPAIGAVSLALLAVMDQFGIAPQAVAGHSYGELTALCASRRFAPRVLYRLSMLRGQLMAAAQDLEGGMLALGAPLTQIEAALKELSVDLVVANHNSPTQVVLSGRIPEIERANALFANRNIRGKKLAVAAAFHSPMVAPASRAFRPVLDEVEFAPSKMPVYANSTATEYPSDPAAARDLLAAQLARPVNFVKEIERMHADGVRTFLEVGPGAVLTGLVNSILNGRDYRAVAVDSSNGKRGGMFDLASALAQLSAAGHEVQWDKWDPQGTSSTEVADSKRMRIPICGANYVKPRTPIPPRMAHKNETVASPVPAVTTAVPSGLVPLTKSAPETSSAIPQTTEAPIPIVPVRAAMPVPRPVPVQPTPAAPVPVAQVHEPVAPTPIVPDSSRTGIARDALRQTLEALQKMQQETTRLHQQFLANQEVALKTFERLAAQHLQDRTIEPSGIAPSRRTEESISPGKNAQSVSQAFVILTDRAGSASVPSLPIPESPKSSASGSANVVIQQPVPIERHQPEIKASPAPVPAVTAQVIPAWPIEKKSAAGVPSFVASTSSSRLEVPVVSPTSAVTTVETVDTGLSSVVLDVVSEKTGYPTAMLSLEMSLDHDLGIDSIKRVEILSSLQERVADLPAFQSDELGSLHTLSDVVKLASSRSAGKVVTSEPPRVVSTSELPTTSSPAAGVATTSGPSGVGRLGPVVLEVVSEKTGYPVEMLSLEMSLDHDLGIDSIKRVEILSGLQERVPGLPAFQPDELGALHTLRDVVALADSRAIGLAGESVRPANESSSAPASIPPVVTPAAPVTAEKPTSSAVRIDNHLGTTVLAVVSEKTGYPVEMLNLEMSLDHDLGIDSIKRVEILSALQERIPELSAFQPEELGSLHTLQDVLSLADARLGRSAQSEPIPQQSNSSPIFAAPVITAAEPAVPRLGPVVLEIVSEKTGYPIEMLNLEMSLDHDLGIDSIKRVEILSALQERVPSLPAFQPEELGALHTLQDVVTLADRRSSVSLEPTPAPLSQQNSSSVVHGVTNAGPDLGPIVLDVVSEKTGYPSEMLNLAMSLDHDLGIDSIKRVEILSALQERVPNLPAFQPEELGSLHTLQDVLTLANGRMAAPLPSVTSNVGSALPADLKQPPLSQLNRSVVRCVEIPVDQRRSKLNVVPGSEIWVTDDGSDLSLRIADELKKLGFQLRIIRLEDPVATVAPGRLAGLVIVAPQQGMAAEHLWNAVRWLQIAGPTLRQNSSQGAVLFATVSRLDGSFGFEAAGLLNDPVSGGLAGIAKCAAREWPEIHSRAFDISGNWPENQTLARKLVDELLQEGPIETGMTPRGTAGLVTVDEPLAAGTGHKPISPGELIVISGGARGVTAEAAFAIARAWQPRLVILGRNPEPTAEPDWLAGFSSEPEIKKALISRANPGTTPKTIQTQAQQLISSREIAGQLSRLRSLGIHVHYFSVDVRDQSVVQQLMSQIQREWGPVRGIIHGAGVLADQKIEDKTLDQFDRVYHTKVSGIASLLASVDPQQLRVLGLFSSYTARFGRVGQIDYAIANEVLNKTARQFAIRYPECRVASFNWGPWDGGMVQGGLRQLFASEGIGLIPLQAGAELVVQELEQTVNRPVEVLVLAKGSDAATPDNQMGSAELVPLSPRSEVHPAASTADDRAPVEREKGSDLKVVLEVSLDLARFPFLESHVIGGKAVLPVAMIMEWLAHAAIHRNPGLELRGFDDFRVYQGIRIDRGEQIELKILAGKSVRVDDSFVSRVQIVTQSNGRETLHAGANVVMSTGYPSAPRSKFDVPLHAYSVDVSSAYAHRLFHGPAFQGILSIEGCAEQGLVVHAKAGSAPGAWMAEPVRSGWFADPLVIDSALQAVILWSQEMRGKPCLPCACSRYRQYRRAFPKDGVRIAVKVSEAREQLIRCEIEFIDQRGILVAQMECCESVADASLIAAFRRNSMEG